MKPKGAERPMSDTRVTPRLQILLTAALFSTGGAAIKATSLSGWQVASFRSGVAALAILIMVPAARARWSRHTVMVGAAYAATMLLFVMGNKLTTAANTIFLQSTAPLYTLLLGPWLLKERIRRQDLLFMVVLATGLALFFVGVDEPQASAPDPLRGNLLGILTGVFWALTLVGLRGLGKGSDPAAGSAASAVVAGNTIACLVALPMALPLGPTTATDWSLIAFLGVVQIGVAYALLTAALRHVPAMEATLLLLVEPVLNPLWAWLFHSELPSGWSFAACALILVATAVRTWSAARRLSSAR
jgi:drug/metabolite transporter (DMT)-like permease